MLHRFVTTMFVLGVTILASGCEFTRQSERSPFTPTGVSLTPVLLGTWPLSTASAGLPTPGSCSELTFNFDQQEGDAYSGSFDGVCGDGTILTGTATGTYQDGVMVVHAVGTASQAGIECALTLDGTALVTETQISIDYSGTSCLGPVSGSETLERS